MMVVHHRTVVVVTRMECYAPLGTGRARRQPEALDNETPEYNNTSIREDSYYRSHPFFAPKITANQQSMDPWEFLVLISNCFVLLQLRKVCERSMYWLILDSHNCVNLST